MSWTRKAVVVLLSALLPAPFVVVRAIESTSPDRDYQVIIDRNPFGLKPPVPPATNAPPAEPKPKEELLLTGITSLGGLKAYFMSKPTQGRTNTEYYCLGVDQKQNALEVLDIDITAKPPVVRVKNGGIESLMTFASHGVKAPAPPPVPAGAPGGRIGAAMPPGGGLGTPPALPTATPTVTSAAAGSGRVKTIPSRNVRTGRTEPNMGQRLLVDPSLDADETSPPNPNAHIEDVIRLEAQRAANPGLEFPPTPMPMAPSP